MSEFFSTHGTVALSGASFIFNVTDAKFTYLSPSSKQLLNIDSNDLLPDIIEDYLFPDDKDYLSDYYEEVLAGAEKPGIDFRLRIANQEKWIRLFHLTLSSDSGTIITGKVEDITSQVNNELTVQKYANKKNSILNMLAHDLRGPLGIAVNISQLISRDFKDEKLLGFVNTISKVVQQSIDLISDLTAREFMESSSLDLVKKRIDIAGKLKDYMAELLKSEWDSKRTFNFSSSADSIFLDVDEAKFMQIQNNLVSNALKFTRDRGNISLHVQDKAHSVLFLYSDDGIGIPAAMRDKVFDQFTDARRKGLRGEPTVGLGLSIVKTIVEWHGGTIWFESTEGSGTTFYVEIPKDTRASNQG